MHKERLRTGFIPVRSYLLYVKNLITMEEKKLNFKFMVLSDNSITDGYSAGCSGSRSDCCTRVCTHYAKPATAEQWGNFLEVNAGVIQY